MKKYAFLKGAFTAICLAPLPLNTSTTTCIGKIDSSIDGFLPNYMETNVKVTSSYNSKIYLEYINKLKSNGLKLQSFKNLSPNWNMVGAMPFDKEFIDNVKYLLENISSQPKVFPTGRNSIQFEYEKENGDYLEFEIFDNLISFLSIINNVEKSGNFTFNSETIDKYINEFYA